MKPLPILLQQHKLKFNVLANAAGFSWLALIQIALIPVSIAFMGIEAYGLLGFYVTMQAILQVFDLGLTPTINREIARLSTISQGNIEIRCFVRTLEYFYWPIGILIGISIMAAAPYISTDWVQAATLPEETVREAILLMGGLMLVQWPARLYIGGLMGTQKQVLANGLQIGLSILVDGGAILVLWLISPTITAFLKWQIFAGLIRFVFLRKTLWNNLPVSDESPRFEFARLRAVWNFAAGMSGITLTAIVLTQFDRVVLSKLLPLEQFGYYMVAVTAAHGLLIIVNPVFNAVFPRFSALITAGRKDQLIKLYHLSAQVMAVLIFPSGIMLCFFSRELLMIWTGNAELARNAWAILCLLVVGRILNGLMHIPYALQLAHGVTRLTLYVNIFLLLLFVPGVIWFSYLFGGTGAAATWAVINIVLIAVGVPLTHRRLMPGESMRWFIEGLIIPLTISVGVIGLGQNAFEFHLITPIAYFNAFLLYLAAIICTCLGSSEARRWAIEESAKIRRALV